MPNSPVQLTPDFTIDDVKTKLPLTTLTVLNHVQINLTYADLCDLANQCDTAISEIRWHLAKYVASQLGGMGTKCHLIPKEVYLKDDTRKGKALCGKEPDPFSWHGTPVTRKPTDREFYCQRCLDAYQKQEGPSHA